MNREDALELLKRDAASFLEILAASAISLWKYDYGSGRSRSNARMLTPSDRHASVFPAEEDHWFGLIHPEDRPLFQARMDAASAMTPALFEVSVRIRHQDGQWHWIHCRGRVVEWDATGAPRRVIGTHTDIDAQQRTASMNQRLAAIIEASSDLIATATATGEIDYINQAGRALLGIGREESLNHTRIADYHPWGAYQRLAREAIPTAQAHGQWLGDNTLRRRDGAEVSVSQLILVHRQPETEGIEFISTICRDLSERQRAEAALKRLQQEQELILDSVPALIWYKDTANRILRVNRAVADSLGLPKSRIEGRHSAEFYPEEADHYYQDDLAVIRTGTPRLGIEEPLPLPSGERRWIRTDKVPLKDAAGRVTSLLVMALDITTQKQAAEALREADRRKDDFLAILAHELRNPLAPIQHAAEILGVAGLNEVRLDWCRAVIQRQVQHLTRLVEDLLDVSRVTRGRITIQQESLDVADIVQRAMETSRPLIDARGHTLSLRLPPDSLRVRGDAIRLTQVLSNLLDNAAKYTKPGGQITLTAEHEGDHAVLRVQDTGIGIPVAMLGQVFEMFVQIKRADTSSTGTGLGIGLNLVKQLVTLHGGTITARSNGEGKGAEFSVHLPLDTAPLPALPPPRQNPRVAASRHRILVADDQADVADSLAVLLDILGQEVRTASDGLQAIEIAAKFQPELILLDLGMPRLDGYDTCRRLRAEQTHRDTLIVALTGWDQAQHQQATQAAGFDQHLVKPVDITELQRLLARLPEGNQAA